MRASRCESPPPLYPRADGSILNAGDIDCVLNRSCVVSVYLFLLDSTCRLSCVCLTLIQFSCTVSSFLIRSFSLICSSWTVLHVSHPFVLDLLTPPARCFSFLMRYFSLIYSSCTVDSLDVHLGFAMYERGYVMCVLRSSESNIQAESPESMKDQIRGS